MLDSPLTNPGFILYPHPNSIEEQVQSANYLCYTLVT